MLVHCLVMFSLAVFPSSYGSVYKAMDKRDGKLVAIKVLEVENEDTIELQKEINILRECDCEYIVRYKGSYRKDGNVWIGQFQTTHERRKRTRITTNARSSLAHAPLSHRSHALGFPCVVLLFAFAVMEFCGAGSLCDLMAICERTLNEEQIAIVLKQSLYGLEYLHAKRKIHRDVRHTTHRQRSFSSVTSLCL